MAYIVAFNAMVNNSKTRKIVIEFTSEKSYNVYEDTLFDNLIHIINEWLNNNYPGEYVDDVIEPSLINVSMKPDIVLSN